MNVGPDTDVFETDFPRYPRVLVAVDDSPVAEFVLRHVVPYVVLQRSRLTLLTVVQRTQPMVASAGVSPQDLDERIEDDASRFLRRLVAALPQDVSVTMIVRHGDPAQQILEVLREAQYDMLCMGARGRGRMTSALLGSVSAAVLSKSPVPVIVLHPPGRAR